MISTLTSVKYADSGTSVRQLPVRASLPGVDVRRLLREERADLAAFLATLPAEQWLAPTLCPQWRVRDVVAHVIAYDDVPVRSLLVLVVRSGFRVSHVNAAALGRFRSDSPQRLLGLLSDHPQPGGLPALLGGRVGLAETLIHHQDIRRALGQPRRIPAERLLTALGVGLLAPDIAGPWRVRGLRLVATDMDFSAGAGSEVRGPAEALLMAIAGRHGVVSELSGPGRPKLARRTGDR